MLEITLAVIPILLFFTPIVMLVAFVLRGINHFANNPREHRRRNWNWIYLPLFLLVWVGVRVAELIENAEFSLRRLKHRVSAALPLIAKWIYPFPNDFYYVRAREENSRDRSDDGRRRSWEDVWILAFLASLAFWSVVAIEKVYRRLTTKPDPPREELDPFSLPTWDNEQPASQLVHLATGFAAILIALTALSCPVAQTGTFIKRE